MNEKEDGRRKKADTELKTKTLHVNVGKPYKSGGAQGTPEGRQGILSVFE